MEIAGFILGVLSLMGGFIPGITYVSWLLAIVGLILSVISRKKLKSAGQPCGFATAGMVCSIIGLVLSVIGFLCTVVCVAAFSSAAKELFQSGEFRELYQDGLDALNQLKGL